MCNAGYFVGLLQYGLVSLTHEKAQTKSCEVGVRGRTDMTRVPGIIGDAQVSRINMLL